MKKASDFRSKTDRPRQPTALMRALEPRIMFDGAAVVTAMDIAHHEVTTSTDTNIADSVADTNAIAAAGPQIIDESHAESIANVRHEIIFVDTSIKDYQSLLADLNPNAEVVLITSQQDGLNVIANTLAGRSGIDAIHILSHGDTGRIQLGNDWIDSADVASRSDLLIAIGQSLNENADILLYGCYVGADGAGLNFVNSLASATAADIAASSDLTGAAHLGGDWDLEANTGTIETTSLVGLTRYQGLLATDQNFDGQAVAGLGSNSVTVAGITYFNNHAFNIAIVNDGFIAAGADHALGYRSSGPNLSTEVGFKTADLTEFKLNSFVVDRGFGSDNSFTVKAYRDSVEVASTTVDVSGGNATFDVSADSSWEYIDEVRISGADLDVDIDDIDFSAAVVPNTAPVISNLNGDSVAWGGVGNTVVLDASANASLTDAELGALNSGNGNWNGASLTVQRSTAVAADNFGFNTSGALFSVSGTSASGNLQSGGQTFATYTNAGGVLTVSFTNSGTTPTTALVNDVARHITYQNDTPAGDATIRFTLHDGTVAGTVANVTVTSDTIYVTNTSDISTIDASNGVGLREAVAIADSDVTGSQSLIFSSALASQTITLGSTLTLGESLTLNTDAASGVTITGTTLSLSTGTLSFVNGSGDTATINSTVAGTGGLAASGAGTLTLGSTSNNGGWSGAVSVAGGTLNADTSSRLSSGTLTLNSGTLAMTVSGAAGTTTTFANTVVLGAGGGTFDVGGGSGANIGLFSGSISGSGSLTKTAAAILQLNGNNNYTGATNVSAGTLIVNHANALGTTAGGTTVTSGASARIAGGLTVADTFTISGTGRTVSSVDYGALHLISGSSTLSGSVTLAANANISAASGASLTLSAVLGGSAALNKTDAGSLVLSSTDNESEYAGGITITAGTLSISNDDHLSSGTISLSGGTLAITGATTINNSINLTSSSTINNSANATLSGVVSGANTLSKAGASTLILSNSNTYAATTVSAGTLSVAVDGNLGSGTVTLASGSTLEVTSATTIDNAVALTGNATVSNSANATLSGVISGGFNLAKTGVSTLTLSNTNTYGGTTTVSAGTLSVASDGNLGSGGLTLAAGTTLAVTGATTIDNAVTLSGATTVNTTADATLSGNIGGVGSLAKTGANTLTLSGTNGYAGTTTVSGGTLSIAGDGNLGSSTITLATGTTLVVTGATTIDNAIALSGNATVQAANAVTLSGAISGGGGLSKTGAGTVTLSGSNGFTGNVAVSAGGLTLSGGAAIDNNSSVTMSSGTTLTLSSSETIGSLAGAGSVALGANTLTAGGDNSSTSYSGNISGTGGGITKTGAGTLTLSGTNSNTGATTISAGAIDAQNGDAIGNASAVSVASGAFLVLSAAETIGSLAGAGTATLGANTLTTGGNNGSTTFSGAITGSNGLVKTGSGTFTLSNTGNESTLSGGMMISAGTVSISDDDQMAAGTLTLNGGTLSLDGPTVFDNNIHLAASSTINSGGNAIASGVISGAGDITKTGSLSLQFTNSNTYTGATIVSAGYLLANNTNSLGTTAGATTVVSGATLYLSGSFTIAEALSLAGTGMLGNGAIYAPSGNSTITGLVTLTGNTTLKLDGDLTFSGGITDGASSYSLTKEDAGTLTLSGTASYDGTTTISSGGLSIGSDSHLGSGALTMATGTTLAITGATTIDNAIALSGGTVTVNNSANATLSGNITGAGGLTKIGASTLTLSGTDGFTGATSVNAGSLLVNGALTATSNTTVASGATLGGSGSISSNVTVNSGGTLSPGNSAGTLTINGDLTMASGSTFVVEINGATAGTGYDQVIVNGTVDVSGATLSVTHAYAAGSADVYNIIVNDAADAVTGSFSGLSEGATVTAGGNSTVLTASYIGATGNDVTLTAPVNPVVTAVSSSTPNGTYKIGDTISVSVTFDTAVFVSGGTPTLLLETGTVDRTLNYVSGSGSTTLVFDYTVQAGDLSADLDYVSTGALVLNGATIQDALNNNANLTLASPGAANSLGANKALVVDGVLPTASIVVADTALAAGETSLVTITFSEAVTGLAIGDFTVANGVLSGLSTGDGGVTWTATLTPTVSTTDPSNLITLDNTGVADAAGNTGTATTDSNNYAIDTLRPTASIVVADTALAAGETSTVTITFNEAVTGLATGDFTVANGVLSGLSTGDGGITWTATLTPTVSTTDPSNLITLDNTGVADAAGNTGTGTTNSNNYAIDTLRPTASIVVADTALAAGETSTVTITFNEAVAGLATGDFTVANGVLSGLSTGDGGITWTATLTPSVSTTDPSNLITLDNTGVADAAGNTGTGTTNSNNYAIDTLRPTASIVVADTALAAGETSTVTITFNEAVAGLATGDFTVANGVLSGLSTGDGGVTWTATLTPTVSTTDTSNLITLDNTGVADAAGNTGTGTTDSNNYAIDTLRPTATIVVADTALAAGETSLVTITFNEAVIGFSNADLTIANGTLTAVSSSDGGVTWTATFTPTASITDTSNVITLDNTSVQDAAGNIGTGTTDSNNYAIDTLRPTATIIVADTALAAGETSLVTITMSEAVANFDNADLSAANGSLSTAVTSDGGITWTATFTPNVDITDTTNVVTFDSTGVIDGGGNIGVGPIDSNNYAIDTARPTASIVVADAALSVGETSLVTITFSEAVTGFSNADLTIANGTLTAVSSSDGGITWTATLTPTASLTDATNLITLDNTGVQDAAGNTGTSTTDSNNYAIDAQHPTATIVVADTTLTAGEMSLVTITFSEAVIGFTNVDLTIANGTLSAVSSSDGGITWTATLTPTASITDTTNLITLTDTDVQDVAGNAGMGTTDSNNYVIDTLPPTATIVVADATLAAGETSLVTFTFNEAVTGFTVADLTVANGVLSGLSSSDGGITWTATLTPTTSIADSTNVITLANTGVQDAAGNTGTGTMDSNNYAIDTQLPTATIVVADAVLTVGETSLVTITFNEAVTGLTNADLTIANGTLSAVSSADGGVTWTATLTPTTSLTDTTNIITLNNSGVLDLEGNTGTSTTDSNNYVIDTVRPTATIIVTDTTRSDTIIFELSASEDITGVSTNSFALTTTGSVSAIIDNVQTVDAHTYRITVHVQGAGTVAITLTTTSSGVTDIAGNVLANNVTSNSQFVDTIPPFVPSNIVVPLLPVIEASTPPPPSMPLIVLPTVANFGIDNSNSNFGMPTISSILATLSGDANILNSPSIFSISRGTERSIYIVPDNAPYLRTEPTRGGAPVQALPDLGVHTFRNNQPISISLPSNTFIVSDRDAGEITVEARLKNGAPLPSWLKFDARTGTLSGQPPTGWSGRLDIEIVMRDSNGNTAVSVIRFEVQAPRAAAGRTALNAQFESAGHPARQLDAALLRHLNAASLKRELTEPAR